MSGIFYRNEKQKCLAEYNLKATQQKTSRSIQTKIIESTTFYDAEE